MIEHHKFRTKVEIFNDILGVGAIQMAHRYARYRMSSDEHRTIRQHTYSKNTGFTMEKATYYKIYKGFFEEPDFIKAEKFLIPVKNISCGNKSVKAKRGLLLNKNPDRRLSRKLSQIFPKQSKRKTAPTKLTLNSMIKSRKKNSRRRRMPSRPSQSAQTYSVFPKTPIIHRFASAE